MVGPLTVACAARLCKPSMRSTCSPAACAKASSNISAARVTTQPWVPGSNRKACTRPTGTLTRLRGRSIEQMIDLPLMEDPAARATLDADGDAMHSGVADS